MVVTALFCSTSEPLWTTLSWRPTTTWIPLKFNGRRGNWEGIHPSSWHSSCRGTVCSEMASGVFSRWHCICTNVHIESQSDPCISNTEQGVVFWLSPEVDSWQYLCTFYESRSLHSRWNVEARCALVTISGMFSRNDSGNICTFYWITWWSLHSRHNICRGWGMLSSGTILGRLQKWLILFIHKVILTDLVRINKINNYNTLVPLHK